MLQLHQVGKNKSESYILTPIFFHSIIAIEIFQISQDKLFFEKRTLNQICGFFQHFLALFETFTTLYIDACIKFEFSG